MINMLSDGEQKQIVRYVECYGTENSYGRPSYNISTILKYWNTEKQRLFQMFGEQFILTKKVLLPDSAKKAKEINKLVCNSRLYDKLTRYFDFFAEDLTITQRSENYYTILNLFSVDSLKNNRYCGKEKKVIVIPGTHKTLDIYPNSKVSRIIQKLAVIAKVEELYKDFSLEHSMILNDKGGEEVEMCLSIHPYDYMTMSDNDCGWNSCMSWKNYGEYRRGTVEMMNSPYVVVAYKRSSKGPHDKAWRQLFVVDEDLVMGIKAYPYTSDSYTTYCLDWLTELAQKYWNTTYGDIKKIECDSDTDDGYYVDISTDTMYNDYGCCDYHLGRINTEANKIIRINISGVAHCLACGCADEYTVSFDSPVDLICADCAPVTRCECCGDRIFGEVYEVDGEYCCEYCYENSTYVCDICEEITFDAERYPVRNVPGRENYYHNRICICNQCMDTEEQKKLFGPRKDEYPTDSWWRIEFFDFEEFSDMGKEIYETKFGHVS